MPENDNQNSTPIVITCVAEDSQFAGEVFSYLVAKIQGAGNQDLAKSGLVTREDDEIHVSAEAPVSQSEVKRILESFLKSDPGRFQGFAVFEVENTFTIGKTLTDADLVMATCEICGYFTPYHEELYTHRMTHLAGFG